MGRKMTRIKVMKDKIKTYKKVFKSAASAWFERALFEIEKTCLLSVKKANPCDLLKETGSDATMSRLN